MFSISCCYHNFVHDRYIINKLSYLLFEVCKFYDLITPAFAHNGNLNYNTLKVKLLSKHYPRATCTLTLKVIILLAVEERIHNLYFLIIFNF